MDAAELAYFTEVLNRLDALGERVRGNECLTAGAASYSQPGAEERGHHTARAGCHVAGIGEEL
jgi:hypothetical protein